MGPLNLPDAGRIYVDTQIIVYTVEAHPTFAPALRPLWQAVNDGRLEVTTSELTVLEMLVVPLRKQDQPTVAAFEAFVTQPGLVLHPISQQILRAAAELRASLKRLRTPDAIHAATAITERGTFLLTNDAGLRGLPGLNTVLLN